MMKACYAYKTSIGTLWICEKDGHITNVSFKQDSLCTMQETPATKKAALQLEEYLRGDRKIFDLPLSAEGTPFQKNVWQALLEIPYGETRSYKQIAESIGDVKAVRAVGMGNNRNPVMIIIPCHRVIGSNGSLIGYAGGLDVKKTLLLLEDKYVERKNPTSLF